MVSSSRTRPNRSIFFTHQPSMSSEASIIPDQAPSAGVANNIHVVLDESFDPFTAVCATVLTEEEFNAANKCIAELQDDLGRSGYLSALRSYKRFMSRGFHAADDSIELSVPFIDDVYKSLPGKAFIYYTDGNRRRDLSAKKTVLLLYACVVQVILLHHKAAQQVQLHFETQQELQRFYPAVADLSARRSRSQANISIDICNKGNPPSLALSDYILHIFGQSIEFIANGRVATEKFQYRNLLAIKNHVSLIYSMERGRVAGRGARW